MKRRKEVEKNEKRKERNIFQCNRREKKLVNVIRYF